MTSFLDYLLPQNTGLGQDQTNYLDRSGLMNAAATLADMSAPHIGGFKATPMQLIAHGMAAYQSGAQDALNQFYANNSNRAKSAAEAVQEYVDKDNLDWFNKQDATYPQTSKNPGVAPTLQDFYKNSLTPSQVRVESGGNPNAVSPKGARGLMQIMPATAKDPGFGVKPMQNDTPAENLRVGQDYTDALLKKYQDPSLALMAYNWGPGNVDKWVASGKDPAAVPAETQAYVQNVMQGAQPAQQQSANPLAAAYQTPDVTSLYKMAERQMRSNRPGAEGLYQLAVMHDPNMINPNAETNFTQYERMTPQQKAEYGQFKMAGQMSPFMGAPSGGGSPGGSTDAAGVPTGDAFLQSLNPSIAAQVKALAEGRMQFPGGMSLKSPYWQQMLQAVSQYDPTFDAVNYNSRSATRKDFTSGQSANNITALNTAMAHAASLKDAYDKLGNTSFPLINSAGNYIENQLGFKGTQTATSDVASKGHALSEELAKVFRSTGMAESDVKAWEDRLSTSATPAQSKAVIDSAMDLIDGRLQALGSRYSQGMGTTKDPLELLSPEARAAYAKIRGTTGGQDVPATPDKQPGKTVNWTIKNGKLVQQ